MADGWWNLDGAIASCLVAYQAIGADSYAASKVNLFSPGTYDAVKTAANESDWTAEYGWDYGGSSTKVLRAPLQCLGTYTFIIRYYGDGATSRQTAFGYYADPKNIIVFARHDTDVIKWINGNYTGTNVAPSAISGNHVLAMAGGKCYRDGGSVEATLGTTGDVPFLGIGYLGGSSYVLDGKIAALAIYSAELSAAQIAALTAAMNALPTTADALTAKDFTLSAITFDAPTLTNVSAEDNLTAKDFTLNAITFDAPTLVNVWATPACRTHVIEAETRTYMIPAEPRTYTIPAESRGLKIFCHSSEVYKESPVYSPLIGTDFFLSAPFFGSPTALPYTCLLKDQFTTAESTPIVSPRSCEPGPGSFTVTDASGGISIAGSKLLMTYAGKYTVPIIESALANLTPGRTLRYKFKSNNGYYGWANIDGVSHGRFDVADSKLYADDTSMKHIGAATSGATYECIITNTGNGRYFWINGGIFTQSQLVWIGGGIDASSVKVSMKGGAGQNTEVSDIIMYEAGGDWTTLNNKRASAISAAIGDSVTHPANALIKCSYTAPAEDVNIYFRYADADNTWILRTKAGNYIKLIEKSGGVETERGSWTGSPVTETFIGLDGDRIWVNCGATAFLTYTSTFNQSATVLKSDVALTGGIYDIYLTPPGTLTGLALERFTTFGDSKGTLGWQAILQVITEPVSHRGLYNTGGWNVATKKVADLKAIIDANLAAATHTPEYVLVNIGINDIASAPDYPQMAIDYGYTLDAIHTRWPDSAIYIAKIWARTLDCSYFNDTLIPSVLSTRSWVSVGLDETLVLPDYDDGDGIHYTTEALTAVANAWKTAIGY